jgi:hypothetical protein
VSPRARIVGLIWWAGVAGFVLLVLGGFASMGTWTMSRFVEQGAAINTGGIRRRLQQLKRLEHYRLPVDTTITPFEAGTILHLISRAGYTGELLPWERPIEARLGPGACCDQYKTNPSRLFDPKKDWVIAAFPLARRGFNSEQRAFLVAEMNNPALAPLRRVARARAADLGAIWDVPPDSVIGWPEIPEMRFARTRAATLSNLAAAALDLEAGRIALAEQRLRETLSFGFLLASSARSGFDESMGVVTVNSARYGLEGLFRATGRSAEADGLSDKSDPQIARPSGNGDQVRARELFDVLRRRILDTTELTSVRWQLMLGPFAYLPCTTQRQMFFGPSAAHRAALQEFHEALVRYPSDERRFGMVVKNVMQLIDPASHQRGNATPRRMEWAKTVTKVTGSDQFMKCATMLSWESGGRTR